MSTRLVSVSLRRCAVVLICLFGVCLAGCHNHPVRHLASDVSLIKAGETTRQEVLSLMGDPDSTRMVSDTAEEWTYYEEDKTMLQKAPVMGGAFSSKGYKTVVLILTGDIVAKARYGAYDKNELDWQDDYTWQKIEQKSETKSGGK